MSYVEILYKDCAKNKLRGHRSVGELFVFVEIFNDDGAKNKLLGLKSCGELV